MSKLVRVSNLTRGKKVLISNGNYSEFLLEVKAKFDLEPDVEVILKDDQGAEIQADVFLVLLDLVLIPNLEFIIKDEFQNEVPLSFNLDPGISSHVGSQNDSVNSCSSLTTFGQNLDFTQILKSTVDSNHELQNLVTECNSKGFVNKQSSTILINCFVTKLIEIKGPSPSTADQRLFAISILNILPCWRYPQSAEGIDILFDDVNRSGLIQSRLRAIHQKLNAEQPNRKRSSQIKTLGSHSKTSKTAVAESPEFNEKLVQDLNSASTKDGGGLIKELMGATLDHRNYLRSTRDNLFLKIYPKFKECDFMINHEFTLMHPNDDNRFLENWPALSEGIVEKAKEISHAPALLKFLAEEFSNWDSGIGALLALLHLIPPTVQGKGKGKRCKLNEAAGRLISFYKVKIS
ncbi:uncharacterized protein LOC118439316 [Folsomia candida]|uniref:uncharacterized protein LOC118439316 n=1 Tax=Folsomia candida TaxID=158441 RepID=UPI001604A7C1|nr:uncharacterized protein LOC118439316 [Folsomia candida]